MTPTQKELTRRLSRFKIRMEKLNDEDALLNIKIAGNEFLVTSASRDALEGTWLKLAVTPFGRIEVQERDWGKLGFTGRVSVPRYVMLATVTRWLEVFVSGWEKNNG